MYPGTGFGGTTSSPFGGSTFGKPPTSVFNTPVFGSTGGSSLFGSTTQPSGGLFGSTSTPAPSFGQPQTAQSTFGGFTSTSSGSGLFGGQQNANMGSTGLFSSTPFGANKPAFGGFGAQQSTGLFGQQQTPAQPAQSLFGQPPAQQSTGLFSSTPAFGGNVGAGGTTIKFTPVTGTDTMVKNGVSSTISTRHHCITCMKEYENKSLEELRLEDYAANRKGPQQGGQTTGLFGATGQQPSLFGTATSTNSTGLFGSTTENKSLFGTSTSTSFGTSGGSTIFGNTGGTSMFNKPTAAASPFGAPQTTTATNFGFMPNTTNNLFGTTQTSGFFSTPNAPVFGTQTSGFTPFSSTQQQGNLFQQSKPSFSLGSNTGGQSFNFGGPATTSTTPAFGAKPTTFSSFSSTAPTSTAFSSPFATTNQNNSFFSNNTFKTPTSSFSFGQTPTSNSLGLNLGGGSSLFNQSKPFNSGTGMFGSNNTFGMNTNFNTGSSLSLGSNTFSLGAPNATNSLSGFMQNSNPSNNVLNQQLLALASMPFGDSPLFKNLIPSSSKSDDTIKPTSPSAQKALLSGLNYKVSPKSGSKVKIIKPNAMVKNSLFEGLDEEEEEEANESLNGLTSNKKRLNPKRLNLKPRPLSDSTRHNQSDFGLDLNDSNPYQGSSFTCLVNKKLLSSPLPEDAPCSSQNDETILSPISVTSVNRRLITHSTPTSVKPIGITKKQPLRDENIKNQSDTQAADPSYSSSSAESEVEETTDNDEPHPTGIVLKRSGYYTIPPMKELALLMDKEGRCIVDNFTVGRINYGNVFYPDSFDVANLNLDKIVHFRHKEVVVYPDDDEKPPVGCRLNRRAQVTLDRVWPIDKTTRLPISDPERIVAMDFESKLRSASARHNTRFIEYRPQTGSWVFKVDHFSKYGLTDSDEEEGGGTTLDMKKKAMAAQTLPTKTNLQPVSAKQLIDNVDGKIEPLADRIFMEDEDEEMVEGLGGPFDLYNLDGMLSPTSKLSKQLGTSAHKLQLMKASFFDHVADDFVMGGSRNGGSMKNFDTDENSSTSFLEPPSHLSDFHQQFRPQVFPSIPLSPLNTTKQPTPQSNVSEMEEDTESSVTSEPPEFMGFRPVLEQPEFAGQSLAYLETTPGQVDSACWLGDLSLALGPTFRHSWGPGGVFTSPLNLLTPDNQTPGLVFTHSLASVDSNHFKDTIVDQLEVALDESTINIEADGQPFIYCQNGPESLVKHQKVASYKFLDEDPLLKLFDHTWSLCVALWGELPGCEISDSYSCVVARRSAVSSWLESVAGGIVNKELQITSGPASVFTHMTCHDIFSACKLAHSNGDFNLSLIISQAGSNGFVRGLIQKQLNEWREAEADRHIDVNRLKLFLLSAGLMTHQASESVVNCCQNLDWIRAFALHLWYVCSSSVTDALIAYDKAWQEENYAQPPLPPYCEPEDSTPPVSVLYHLLKLYSNKSTPLECLLNPNTHTDDPLDYRLSWLLMRVLCALGYSHISPYNVCLITTGFASQLEAYGLWHWSVFVLLHIKSPEREKLICETIERNIVKEEDTTKEDFLRDQLKVPKKWIAQAKATRAIVHKNYKEAAVNLLEAEDWNYAHEIIINHISSKAVVNEKYDFLESLLKEIEKEERFRKVYNWDCGGSIFLDYIEIIRMVETIKTNRDDKLVGKLTHLVAVLSPRVKLLKNTIPIDRLCQEEIAERMAALVQGVCKTDHSTPAILSDLPLLPDYSQSHWQTASSTDWLRWDDI